MDTRRCARNTVEEEQSGAGSKCGEVLSILKAREGIPEYARAAANEVANFRTR
jgi:hypothetical protein